MPPAAIIRLAQDSDAAAIADIYRPSVDSSVISFETRPPDEDEIKRRLARTLPTHPWIVCELRSTSHDPSGGRVAGYAYASQHQERSAYRWSVNVSVYIDEKCRRAGVGRGLYASLFAILTAQGYVNAYAGITLPNPSSVGLHEAMGFERFVVYRKVGYKLGAWHDVGWWQRALNAHDPTPREPIDVPTLARDPRWASLLATGVASVRGAAC